MSIGKEIQATRLAFDDLSESLLGLNEKDKDDLLRIFFSRTRALILVFDPDRSPFPVDAAFDSAAKLKEELCHHQSLENLASIMLTEIAELAGRLQSNIVDSSELEKFLQMMRWMISEFKNASVYSRNLSGRMSQSSRV